MSENNNNCDGCYSRIACANIYVYTNDKCPCNTCIVKMVFCQGCEEYNNFRRGAKRRLAYRDLVNVAKSKGYVI